MPSDAELLPSRRVLLAILVFGGHEVLGTCLASAARLRGGHHEIDVVVLDDCSPDPAWSRDLAKQCAQLSIGYYRSPRNLGIPRNMNLALLLGHRRGYDHTAIVNSDVILPANFVDGLLPIAERDPAVGTVTAWSNNVSIYSLPSADDQGLLASQEMTDWVSEAVADEFGPAGVPIPVGVGFCLLVPTATVEKVGLFDPVFGRGYCEEVDYCLRCKAQGLENLLAPNVFVYHKGSASTRIAGLLAEEASTVLAHEQIVDLRYPHYRSQVAAYQASDTPATLTGKALRRLLIGAATTWGYVIEVGWLDRPSAPSPVARIVLRPDDPDPCPTARFLGFRLSLTVPPDANVVTWVEELLGCPPLHVAIHDRGRNVAMVSSDAARRGVPVLEPLTYPERV